MNNFKYENQGSNTYLVYQVAEEKYLDTLTLGMLTNNQITNFIPVIYTRQDAEQYLKYNVTAKVTVGQLWEDTISKKHLLGVLNGIVSAVLNAEEYMMDINSLIFDTDKMFVDISTGNTELICLPITEAQSVAPDMKAFFKEILFAARLNPSENNDYFVRLINFINGRTQFSVEACKEILDEIMNGTSEVVQRQGVSAQQTVNTTSNVSMQNMSVTPNSKQTSVNQQNSTQRNVQETSVLQTQVQQKQLQQPQSSQGFAVPGMNKDEKVSTEDKKTNNSSEKEISWFYLMQHYNKENAALYKEQKAKKKQDKENEKSLEKDKKKNKKEKKGKQEDAGQAVNFAVPGGGTSMAIPGQQTSAPTAQSQTSASHQPNAQTAQTNSTPVTQQSVQTPVSNLYSQQIPSSFTQSRANFGETTVLSAGGMGETTVLSNVMLDAQAPRIPYLLRSKNSEKIMLNKPIFRIGKEKSYVDYFIGDNTAISRSHADIITKDGVYYIRDNNSTNHTYVNGAMIPSNTEIAITEGAKIRLANEDFEFLF